MILLSNASLDYAYQICKERSNFYVVVACSSEQEKIRVREYLLDKLAADTERTAVNVRSRNSNLFLCFASCSFIKVIGTSSSVRGNRAHLLLVDRNISENVIRDILLPMEIGEWGWRLWENMRVKEFRNEIRSDRINRRRRR